MRSPRRSPNAPGEERGAALAAASADGFRTLPHALVAGLEGAPGAGPDGAARGEPGPPAHVPDGPLGAEAHEAPQPPAPALPPPVRVLVEGIESADAFELDRRLRALVALEQRLDAELAPLLRGAADRRLHRRRGLPTFAAYVREHLGLGERKARALLRLERVAAGCPALRRAFASGALSWVRAQALLPVLALPQAPRLREAWVAWAQVVSVRRLEDDVAETLHRAEVDPEGFAATGGLPEERQIRARARGAEGHEGEESDAGDAGSLHEAHAHEEEAAEAEEQEEAAGGILDGGEVAPATPPPRELETARYFFRAPAEVAQLFRAVVCSVRRRLDRPGRPASPGDAVEWMLDHAFATWGADDPRVRREHRVFARDGWRCTVPGCSSYRNLHDHHIVFRSAGGGDALTNRTTLCAFHHLRGVHGGRVRCLGRAPDAVHFELGLRRGWPPLLRYEAGERLLAAGATGALG